jgi:NIPSNAP protein
LNRKAGTICREDPKRETRLAKEGIMITLCICYTIDLHKTADFEQYARRWPEPIKRCGGDLIGYFLPTKFAGPTNVAYALIRFANLTAYEKYREALGQDPDAIVNVAAAEASRCILVEDRSFLQKVPE